MSEKIRKHGENVYGPDILTWYFVGQIRLKSVEVTCDPSLTNALRDGRSLRLQSAFGVISVKSCTRWICKADLARRILRLEVHADSRQSSACTNCAAEGIHFAVSLLPDLRTRRLEMCTTVRSVIELLGPKPIELLRNAT